LIVGDWTDYEKDYRERFGDEPSGRRGKHRGLKR
jgi:hypothetical protein